jgi:integrase
MFSWAVSRDIVPVNPCADVGAPAKDTHRDRILSVDEIVGFWNGFNSPDLEMSRQVSLALKLQLATAQRKGEVIAAEWTEFDIEGERVWTIPKEKAKNGLAHRVPLSALALSLLKEIRQLEQDRVERINKRRATDGLPADVQPSRWLFPSRNQDASITAPAVDHAFRKNLPVFGLVNVTPHDLRRTAASQMTGMSINRLVVGKILNHAEQGVTAVYDRHSYDAEKKRALDAWGDRLTEIVTGECAQSNVAQFVRHSA